MTWVTVEKQEIRNNFSDLKSLFIIKFKAVR